MIRTALTRALDRAADRLMTALPTSRAGAVAITAIGGALVTAAIVHWLGWRFLGALVLIAAADTAFGAVQLWRGGRSC